jgi:hypothetical protein
MASGDAHASCRALTKTRSSPSSSARSMVCPLRTNTSRRHVTRASVDRSGRRLRGTARADRRSVGSGLTPDNTALRRGRAMLPGPPAQPPSVQGRTTTAPRRLVPRWSGPWAAESEPRTGWPRSAPDAVDAGGPGLPDGRVSRREQAHQSGSSGRFYVVRSESSTDADDGSPKCPKDQPETSDSRPRQCIPPGSEGLTPNASTRASLR